MTEKEERIIELWNECQKRMKQRNWAIKELRTRANARPSQVEAFANGTRARQVVLRVCGVLDINPNEYVDVSTLNTERKYAPKIRKPKKHEEVDPPFTIEDYLKTIERSITGIRGLLNDK